MTYRVEAWEFILAGGGLFNHLDYSFVAGHEDGTFVYPTHQPGGGSPAFRRELIVLKNFINGFQFNRMTPMPSALEVVTPAGDYSTRALAEPGKAYAVYIGPKNPLEAVKEQWLERQASVALEVPSGKYRMEWIHTLTGNTVRTETYRHSGGRLVLKSPPYRTDIALKLTKR